MVHILEGQWETPWSVAWEVRFIQNLKGIVSARVQHSLREGNTLADYFANLVFDFAGNYQLNSVQEVPNEGKKIIYMDKSGTPNIRRFLAESIC
ncbi:hypothetical protein MTR67_005664 [Solanum verrucosum]|uniref:RNase H type-1 domain-containing protein n=1 Tax=Solanum verrucosum TaxID=315347 RepID=A0AAF0TBK5_SOLVR|nr:hypothetical protein MTR67_005664 [Solanum verrucosum]